MKRIALPPSVVNGLIAFGAVMIVLFVFLDFIRGKPGFDFGPVQYAGIGFGLVLVVAGLSIRSAGFRGYLGRALWALALLLFVPGAVLLLLNVYGEFVSLRNPAIYKGFYHGGKLRVPKYTPEETFALMPKGADETLPDYAHRATMLIFDSTVHLWEHLDDYSEYHHHIPVYENFILWGMAYVDPEVYIQYQFCDARKAIERGVSICDQAARIMRALWNSAGMNARLVTLDGHVITEALMDRKTGTWWVLDADYGVVLEADVETLSRHLDQVKAAYMEAGYSEADADVIASFYGPEGNYVITDHNYCKEEALFYRLKWIIPSALSIPFVLLFLVQRVLAARRARA